MPKLKQVIEYEYGEFEQLAIETFGLMKDWSVVASEEWGNDSDHQFYAEPAGTLDEYERKELTEIEAAAAEYQAALGSGADPYAFYMGKREENEAVKKARGKLWKATQYNTRLLFAGLVEKGKIGPGEYLISVCW